MAWRVADDGRSAQVVLGADDRHLVFRSSVEVRCAADGEVRFTLATRVAPGGRIALSGILHGQEDDLLVRYGAWFEQLVATQEGDWMRIDGVRR